MYKYIYITLAYHSHFGIHSYLSFVILKIWCQNVSTIMSAVLLTYYIHTHIKLQDVAYICTHPCIQDRRNSILPIQALHTHTHTHYLKYNTGLYTLTQTVYKCVYMYIIVCFHIYMHACMYIHVCMYVCVYVLFAAFEECCARVCEWCALHCERHVSSPTESCRST